MNFIHQLRVVFNFDKRVTPAIEYSPSIVFAEVEGRARSNERNKHFSPRDSPILLFLPISTSPLLSFILYTFPRLSSDFHAVFHRVFRFSSRPFEWAERLKWFFEANLSHRIRIILECYSRCERSIWNEILSRSWRSWILERCIIDTYLFIEMDDRKGDFFEIFVYSREVGKVSKESFYIYLKVVGKIFDIVFLILCNERRNYRWRLLINL